MRSVFEASSGLDAHMVLNLLETHGIGGRIEGEYLQGGIGELSALGFVRVLVADEDYAAAREIIDEWESVQPAAAETREPERRPAAAMQNFIAGVFVGAAVMYWLMKVSAG